MKTKDLLQLHRQLIVSYNLLNAILEDVQQPTLVNSVVKKARNEVSAALVDINRAVTRRLKI